MYKNIKVLNSISVIYNLKVWNQDVHQAYIQAQDLEIDFYLIPDPLFVLPVHIVLKLLKPIYELTESGVSWFHKHIALIKTNLALRICQ